jgi:hypothetical protein
VNIVGDCCFASTATGSGGGNGGGIGIIAVFLFKADCRFLSCIRFLRVSRRSNLANSSGFINPGVTASLSDTSIFPVS